MRVSLSEYQAFARDIAGSTRLWVVPFGLVAAFFGVLISTFLVLGAGAALTLPEISWSEALLDQNAINRFAASHNRASNLALLATFLGPAIAIVLWCRLVHKWRPGDLLGRERRIVWRDFGIAGGIVIVVTCLGLIMSAVFGDITANVPIGPWLVWLLPVIALIFIQSLTEELIFRGYLQPVLAARFRSPLIWLLLPAAFFGVLHYWTATDFGANKWLAIVAVTLMGVIAGHVTARTGNISASLGLHVANNCVGILLVATPGELDALSLYLQPLDHSDPASIRAMLLVNIATIAIGYAVYLWVLRRRDARLQ